MIWAEKKLSTRNTWPVSPTSAPQPNPTSAVSTLRSHSRFQQLPARGTLGGGGGQLGTGQGSGDRAAAAGRRTSLLLGSSPSRQSPRTDPLASFQYQINMSKSSRLQNDCGKKFFSCGAKEMNTRPPIPGAAVGPRGTMGKEHIGEASGDIYTYKHRSDNGVDIHEIFVKKSRARVLLSYAGVIFLLAIVFQSLLRKESLCLGSVWSITFGVLMAKCLQYKPVMKESVVIMPSFGVQLEIHFWSGTVDRCFIPIGKILKPLLNECVTPVTCYWCLALLLRDEEELKLVFQKFRPPVKMLVPIWKALCAFTNSECASQPSAVSEPNWSEA